MKRFCFLCMVLATWSALANPSPAESMPVAWAHEVPSGVQVGDTVQLLFVSRDVRDAQSADIGDYNEFVNSVADAAGIGPATFGVQWFAVASTVAVDARDNAVVQAPVYNMQGELLALDFADMWDGTLAHAVTYDEHGVAIIPFHHVWTGSRADGTAYSGRELGGIPTAGLGDLKRNESGWIETSNGSPMLQLHIYALSEPLLVVPEPSTPTTLVLVTMGLIAAGNRRRRR